MGKLILSTTMTVDGVISVGEWYVSEGEHDRAAREQFEDAAVLLGRTTYEVSRRTGLPRLARGGPDQPDAEVRGLAHAERIAQLDARAIDGDLEDGVTRLKNELDSDLILIGCGELARNLLAAGLIDELRFWVHPVVWGQGERPFQSDEQARLRLVGAETFDSGVTLLRYEPSS